MRLLVALVLLGSNVAAVASPESEALKRQGLQSLAAASFAQAVRLFSTATQVDSGDLEAAYLHGVAANRLGQFSAAEAALLRAESGGYRNVELDFEFGWIAMAGGRPRDCIVRLERFEAAVPGRGQTSEFLGRCHLALRQFEPAEAMFKRALERDARLAPTVNLALAGLEQARGKPEAAGRHIEIAAGSDAPAGRALRELAGPAEPAAQPEKPLRMSISLTAGYNDNVIGLGNTIPLPTDISRKGAGYERLSFGASYTRQFESQTSVSAGYALLLDRYNGLGAANLNDHYVYADLFRQISNRIGASLRASAEFTELGNRRFRDAWALRPALSYRHSAFAVTELSYTYSDSDYKTQSTPVFSRDGASHGIALVHSFRLPGTRWGGALGATYGRNRPEGGDFQSDSFAASATLRYTFANRVVAALGVSATRDDYTNPNSLAGTGFSFTRADRQQLVSAQLTGPLSPRMRWYFQAQSLRNNSNIAFYAYRQNIVSAGIAVDF